MLLIGFLCQLVIWKSFSFLRNTIRKLLVNFFPNLMNDYISKLTEMTISRKPTNRKRNIISIFFNLLAWSVDLIGDILGQIFIRDSYVLFMVFSLGFAAGASPLVYIVGSANCSGDNQPPPARQESKKKKKQKEEHIPLRAWTKESQNNSSKAWALSAFYVTVVEYEFKMCAHVYLHFSESMVSFTKYSGFHLFELKLMNTYPVFHI